GAGVHYIERARILLRRIDVAAQTQRRRREREHPCELPPAENTDGGAGLQQAALRSFPCKRGASATITELEILCTGFPLARRRAEWAASGIFSPSAVWPRTSSAARARPPAVSRSLRLTPQGRRAPGAWLWSRFACDSASTAAARSAASVAPGLPIASVPTGMPAGICMIDSSESLPSRAC